MKRINFLFKIPFFSKIIVSSLIYFGITFLYSNLTWNDLRLKLPFLNRMFYSKHLSILEQYRSYTEIARDIEKKDQNAPILIDSFTVQEEWMSPTMAFSAVLEPMERVEVYSKISGRVERLFVKEGDLIKKGQKLAKLDSLTFELDFAKHKAAKDSAYALLQLAKEKENLARKNIEIKLGETDKRIGLYHKAIAEFERYSEILRKKEILWSERAISDEEFENIKLEHSSKKLAVNNAKRDLDMILIGIRDEDILSSGLAVPISKKEKIELLKKINTKIESSETEVAASQVRASEVNLKSAEMLLQESILYAPSDGLIAKINRTEGELINAGSGGLPPILTIISNKGVYVSFAINEGDLGKVKIGNETNVTIDALPNKSYLGKVKKISPLVDQKTHTADAKVELSGKHTQLRPGMFVRAEVKMDEKKNAIFIPQSAVVSLNQEEASVYIVRESRVFKQKIKLGEKQNDRILVEEGLDSGDRVVLGPFSHLYDGVSVIPKTK
ncbi:MAG: efflux RND transporter periplasmic adaptor subunit [Leptospira sp.]|nr:efflux RND transporter periplasmic adaptor subunit [Leptospira sp.]